MAVRPVSTLQVFWGSSQSLSYMDYDTSKCSDVANSLFHDMSEPERKGNWVRCWSAL